MLEGYKNGRKLNRAKVCIDIKNRKILFDGVAKLLSEIDQELAEGNLDTPYISETCAEKISRESGEKDHLDRLLAMASSGECFNANYLFYLAGVAAKPKGKGLKAKVKRFAIVFAVILVSLAIAFGSGFIVTRKQYSEVITQLKAENAELSEKIAEYEQIKAEKELVLDELEKAKTDYNETKAENRELLKLPLGQFLVKQVLSGADEGMLSESFEKSGYKTEEICDIAISMKLSRKEMERVRDCLNLNEKKIDWTKFGE